MRNFIKTFLLSMFVGTFALPFTQAQTQVVIGTGTSTTNQSPTNAYWGYSWNRILYLSSEIGNTTNPVCITKIAFAYDYSESYNMTNQTCYLEATTDTVLSTGYINPASSGATQVWTGTLNLVQGWVEITLTTPYLLPAGANLMLHWHHKMGSWKSSSYVFKYTTKSNTVVYAQSDSNFPDGSSGSLSDNRPNIRLTLKPLSRTASVTEIVTPAKSISWGTNLPASAKIANLGSDTITSCKVNWKVNGATKTSINYTQPLIGDSTPVTINLGTFTPDSNTMNNLTVWIDNATPYDSIQADDTLSFDFYTCTYALTGTYTVGGAGAYFATITDAINHLMNCGVSGPTTFLINSGTYNESINMVGAIPGASATNTVTITSANGNASDVTIGDTTTLATTALTIDNVSYLLFKNITIGTNSSNTGIAVELKGMCENILFYGCNIQTYRNASSNYMGIRYTNSSGSTAYLKNVRFIKNNLDGGYANFWFNYACGNADSLPNSSVYIDSNTMTNASKTGVFAQNYGNFRSISYNTINTTNTLTYYSCIGIYLSNYAVIDSVIGNKIRIVGTTTTYNTGIYIEYYTNNAVTYPTKLYNNEIIITGNGYNCGIYNDMGKLEVYHNSIYLEGTEENIGFFISETSTSYPFNAKNNNIVCAATHEYNYPLFSYEANYIKTTGGGFFDYNNYYSAGPYIAYIYDLADENIASLEDLRTITEQDSNSVSIRPHFINVATNLRTDGKLLICPVIAEVPKDIDDTLRTSLPLTNMGCYHDFKPLVADAKMFSIESPTMTLNSGVSTPVSVKIQNFGTTALDSVKIHWIVNGTAQTPVHWKNGPLAPFAVSSPIPLGNFTPKRGFNTLQVYVAQPNGVNDLNTTNDTLLTTLYACDTALNGTYTVGVGGDFINAKDVEAVLTKCGIKGPVEFQFFDGSYETMLLDTIIGSSTTNTVTITSYSGDATKVTIGDVTIAKNTALTLDNVSNLVFKNITIGTKTDATISGVELKGYCANILFHSCVIQAYDLATDNSYAAVKHYNSSYNSANYLKNVRFIKNTIIGGYGNMLFIYSGGNATNMSTKQTSIIIDSNELKDAYYCGIYNYYYGYYPSISYNTITSRAITDDYYNGIYSYRYTTIDSLQGNKISITSSNQVYGMYMIYYQNHSSSYGASGPMYIANNEIRIKSTGTLDIYGFYTESTSDYSSFDILHNSFYLEGTTGDVYGICVAPRNTSAPTNVLNNLVYVSTSGDGYMITYGNMSYVGTSYGRANYNNYYYKPSSGTTYYGSTSYTSLSAWKASGYEQDTNSVNVSPQFIDVSKDLQLSSYTGLSCPRIVGVGKDIRNKSRSATTYMGCYDPYALDAALDNDNTMPLSGTVNQSIPIKAILMNYGKDTLKKASINWSVRGVTQSTTIPWTGNLATGKIDTVNVGTITLTSAYSNEVKIWVSAPNESTDPYPTNDTISFNIYGCDSMLSGVYTVGNASADFATVEEAKFHLMECGIKGAVELQLISGTYASLSFTKNIPGSSTINTVTITSVAQHADSVMFVSIVDEPALTLENMNNIYFKALTFDATNGTHGVELKKSNSGILLYACTILAKPELFFNYYSGVCYAQTSTDTTYLSNVRFIKNKISGGMYNIYLEYAGGNNATTMVNSSIIIDSNELCNAHLGGILSNYYAYFPSISYNIITSHANATIGYYCGIDCYYYTTIDTMKSNKIHITFTSNSTYITYGINTNYNQNTVSGSKDPMFVANNEIMITGEGNATNYGIYASCGDSSQWNFYNNSIYIANDTGTSYGMHWGPTDSIGYVANFINNHVHLHTDGTAVPLIFEDTTYATTSYCRLDYNNYYVSGGPASVYYTDTSYKTLAAWKSAYSQDTNSVSIAPIYMDSLNSLRFSYDSLLRAPILPNVYNDINGYLRITSTSIGAYEIHPIDLELNSLLSPLNNAHFCQNSTSPIEVSITNVGSNDLNMETSPLSVHVRITGAINYQIDTIISTGTLASSQKINVIMDNSLALADSGMCYVSAYFSKIDSNRANDTVYSQFYVHRSYNYADTVTICSSQLPYKRGDSTFTKGGNYTIAFTTINGCDSTIALTLIEDDAYKVKTTITICDDQLPYTYNDSILTDAGLYQFEYPASPGECDTILYVTLVVNSTYNETDTIKICSSELPYTYGDSVFTEGGDYILPYLTEFGCDSVINLHLKVIEIPVSPLVINGNTTITTAGKYTYYVNPVEGADSYVWTISNNNWTGSSTTESIELTISDAGTGTLAVKAINICGESDTAALDISSSVGILENDIKTCYLGQNIPNPANTSTLIPFSIPEAGNVSFEVVSITGQVLCKKDIQALTGSNSIELDTEILPAGIYYYRIEFNGQRLVKKMTIQK